MQENTILHARHKAKVFVNLHQKLQCVPADILSVQCQHLQLKIMFSQQPNKNDKQLVKIDLHPC